MNRSISCSLLLILFIYNLASADPLKASALHIKKSADFALDGSGTSPLWENANWVDVPKYNELGQDFDTRFKMLHSETGVYFLFHCEDDTITSTLQEDYADIFREDAVEIFIWPDESSNIYFEYEISPANYELILLVPNYDGDFHGWRPWRVREDRETRHETQIHSDSEGQVTHWTAEFFIPYALFKPLQNVPAEPGTHWRANFYRADRDTGERAIWAWKPFEKRFHEYKKFGYLYFSD
ncbi:MAG: carbohydrate-binding family 9-like protein [Opitutales bacterium]